ncbi:Conserved fungal protein [Geosmithia morbida]|uniref:Conserved fungal protein n=1 Tax=Geosmithia morbida TaxID=1094350 RepID=A0A9P4YUA9_9HYPO|nr:Conserved fungal protein [Geosmithia morbida]KAF4121811.1 Conserved fungal protein [Geosmithia morbida]
MASSSSPSGGTYDKDQLCVNLQVVSPSVGVTRPLIFPGLPASTTLKQLKEKIRQALPFRPTDENQRLIARGRALLRDTDTLLDVLGDAIVRSNEQQTMHLVLREAPAPTVTAAAPRDPSPAPPIAASQRPPSTLPQQLGPQPPPGFPRRNPAQPAGPFPAPPPVATPPAPNNDGLPAVQHQHMSNWLAQLQRDSRARTVVNQNQRTRAMLGMRGIGDNNNPGGQEPTSGRASPALGHYYRETVGPNGQTYQVETVIRGSAGAGSGGGGGLSPADVQNILRNADLVQATMATANAMHRSASGASLHSMYNSRPLNQPGATTPAYPLSDSRAPSGRATPDAGMRSTSAGSATLAPPRQGTEVYILSSPEGPRGILVNNNSETYYTPRIPAPAASYLRPRSLVTTVQVQAQPPPLQDGVDDPDNPQEPGLPPLLLQAWPHIWLVFRLALFVWFFTSPQASWGRWLSVIGLAVFIFVVSIGALQGIVDVARRPIAQHLQNAVPRLEPHRHHNPRGAGNDGDDDDDDNNNPDPANMAARLVARREQTTWLQSQIRRAERAGLLFLASIAPGVAERHIADLEAEARAERERERREAEAAAADAARRRQEEEEGEVVVVAVAGEGTAAEAEAEAGTEAGAGAGAEAEETTATTTATRPVDEDGNQQQRYRANLVAT